MYSKIIESFAKFWDSIIHNGFNMPAQIFELKMYNDEKPLRINQG